MPVGRASISGLLRACAPCDCRFVCARLTRIMLVSVGAEGGAPGRVDPQRSEERRGRPGARTCNWMHAWVARGVQVLAGLSCVDSTQGGGAAPARHFDAISMRARRAATGPALEPGAHPLGFTQNAERVPASPRADRPTSGQRGQRGWWPCRANASSRVSSPGPGSKSLCSAATRPASALLPSDPAVQRPVLHVGADEVGTPAPAPGTASRTGSRVGPPAPATC